MLVRHHVKGWKVISHYTHALFAGKVGNHLLDKLISSHWPETLTAIINHDDQMVDFNETNYLTEAGTPKDFTMESGNTKDAVIHAKRLYKEAIQKSQWICLLVSRHIEFLYQDNPDEEMKEFLKIMYEKRKQQRRLYKITIGEENHLYEVLRFCDRVSLIVCGDEVPETGRLLEINTSINNDTYQISSNDDNSYKIEPWIFSKEKFEVDYEYKILEQITYKSNKQLEQCISEGKLHIQKVVFKK